MARKQSAEAKILNLYDELSEDGQRIVFDLLRSKQPKKSVRKSSGAKKRAARTAGTPSSQKAPRKGLPPSTDQQTAGVTSAAGDGSEDVS